MGHMRSIGRGGPHNLKLAQVREILHLEQRLRMASDSLTRKRRLLEGLCGLVGGNCASCVMVHADGPRGNDSPSRCDTRHHRRSCIQTLSICGGGWSQAVELISPLGEGGELDSAPQVFRPVARLGRARRGSGCIVSCLNFTGTGISANMRICCDDQRFSSSDREFTDLVHLEMSWVYEPDLLLASAMP